jgi:NAD(P)-dependent dehydrogenase (short-subunit alcohol dehydrogenase family)
VNWIAADLPDMTGRTVLVTGGSDGIGLVASREFARVGARVVLCVRSIEKGNAAASTMTGITEVRHLEMASLASIRSFADEWVGSIDLLINNAGIFDVPLIRTSDGFESQMATNYFGPFVLTNLLLPHVTDRVVSISSQLHRQGKLHLDDLNSAHQKYKSMQAYRDSKLYLNLFSFELQRRLTDANSKVRSMIAHPGIATTNLASHTTSGKINNALRFLLNDAEHGALPTLFAATQDIGGNSYVGPNGFGSIKGFPLVRKPSSASLDAKGAVALWKLTAEMTNTDFLLHPSN